MIGSIILILLGLGWLLLAIIKDATTRPIAPNQDIYQAFIDSHTKGISGKELDRRLTNGYYTKKK